MNIHEHPLTAANAPASLSLTVLLTVYNGMPYLQQAVGSIMAQALPNMTFLVLDNASTDGSGEWLSQLAATPTDTCLHVVRLPENIGRTAVLNKGLGLITTELVAIIDADDVAVAGRLHTQRDFFERHSGIDLLGSDVAYIDTHGAVSGYERFPIEHEALCNRLPLFNQFAHAACMFRLRPALAAGGYPANVPYAQDFALWLAMLRNGSRVASIPERLAHIRVHTGQATRDPATKQTRNNDTATLAAALLQVPGLSPAARQATHVRLAGALFALHQKRQAAAHLWQALCLGPVLFVFNPLLWERVRLVLRRKSQTMRRVPLIGNWLHRILG